VQQFFKATPEIHPCRRAHYLGPTRRHPPDSRPFAALSSHDERTRRRSLDAEGRAATRADAQRVAVLRPLITLNAPAAPSASEESIEMSAGASAPA
jgi:hypothetical protein